MKKITITKALQATDIGDENPKLTGFEIEGEEDMEASDGYHTFGELYEHRVVLFIKLCHEIKLLRPNVSIWRSTKHHDGSLYAGWFIMGIRKQKGEQITYHLPMARWEETDFAETLEKAPEWDGHTSDDVLERLKNL